MNIIIDPLEFWFVTVVPTGSVFAGQEGTVTDAETLELMCQTTNCKFGSDRVDLASHDMDLNWFIGNIVTPILFQTLNACWCQSINEGESSVCVHGIDYTTNLGIVYPNL